MAPYLTLFPDVTFIFILSHNDKIFSHNYEIMCHKTFYQVHAMNARTLGLHTDGEPYTVNSLMWFQPCKPLIRRPPPLPLTSEPGGAVGLGGRRVDAEALAGQHAAVLGLLHQEAYFGQQPVQETGQHGRASDHHHVLG